MFGVFRDCCESCSYCRDNLDHICQSVKHKEAYDPHLGGYATHFQGKASFFFTQNPELDPRRAAPLMCAGSTVYSPLIRNAIPDGVCGVVGIGGLGHMALQYANKMGMKVVAFSTSPDKEIEAKELGAHEFVCTKDPEQMKHWKGDAIY